MSKTEKTIIIGLVVMLFLWKYRHQQIVKPF